jgi:hypothetical protein
MARQLRFYLRPSDVGRLLDDLKQNSSTQLFLAKSPTSEPLEVDSNTLDRCHACLAGLRCYDQCYLSRDARIATWFVEKQGYWLIDTESEVIEFSGCNFSDLVLVEGRFSYQIDRLSPRRDAIVPKTPEFVKWAEKVFRRSKKHLIWDKELEAYLGADAAQWRGRGLRFTQGFELLRAARAINEPLNTITQ